jgi:predicted MFS family arabinose efflux permease
MTLPQKQARNSTYALVLLTTIYILGYADRSVINLLLDPIKAEFQLTDTILGLITGFGFSLFQVSLGIPIARLADRRNRVNILTGGLLLWSTMTLLCGRVSSEACLVAPSHSLLTDFTPKKNRTRAFGVLASGGDIGMMLGLLVGGWVSHYWGWRAAFIVAGLPGIVVALLFWLTLQEPERENDPKNGNPVTEPLSTTMRFLLNQKSYVYAVLGGSAIGLTLFPIQVWGPAFLRRIHHLDSADVGTYMSLVRIASIVGVVSGGIITDAMCRRGEQWRLRIPAIAVSLAAPAFLLFLFANNVWVALIALGLTGTCIGAHQGALFAVCQTVVKPHMRALSSSIFIFTSAMVGSGLGSLLVGMLSDALTPQFGQTALRYALLMSVFTALLAGVLMWRGARSIESDITKATS